MEASAGSTWFALYALQEQDVATQKTCCAQVRMPCIASPGRSPVTPEYTMIRYCFCRGQYAVRVQGELEGHGSFFFCVKRREASAGLAWISDARVSVFPNCSDNMHGQCVHQGTSPCKIVRHLVANGLGRGDEACGELGARGETHKTVWNLCVDCLPRAKP